MLSQHLRGATEDCREEPWPVQSPSRSSGYNFCMILYAVYDLPPVFIRITRGAHTGGRRFWYPNGD